MKTNCSFFKKILTLQLVMLMGLLIPQLATAQDWYNTDWPYRRPVTVPNLNGSALSNYQIMITLNSGSFNFANSTFDGSDIRITDADGTTMIPFWIEKWNPQSSAIIWVKVPNIPTRQEQQCTFTMEILLQLLPAVHQILSFLVLTLRMVLSAD